MSTRFILLATLLATVPLSAQKRGSTVWFDDYDKAVRAAKRSQKDLLVDFTGSDWCHWCVKLKGEVLGKEEFVKLAKKRFVLVALDFPMDDELKQKVPNPKRNQELKDTYGVTGYPTVLLLRRDGTVLGRTGYREGGAIPYAKHIEELRTSGLKAVEAVARLERAVKTAKPDAKEPLVREALARLEKTARGGPGCDTLCSIVERAFDIDGDNARGLLHMVIETTIKGGTASPSLIGRLRKYDPKNEKRQLQTIALTAIRRTSPDAAEVCDEIDRLTAAGAKLESADWFFLNFNAALWSEEFLKDLPRAKKYAKVAMGLEPDEKGRAQLEKILAKQ